MRTFRLTLSTTTDAPWQHRDVPERARVVGVFCPRAPDSIDVHYEAPDEDKQGRLETEALVVIREEARHQLGRGRHDPCRDPGRSGSSNLLEHVGSAQDRGGVVFHVYRRT